MASKRPLFLCLALMSCPVGYAFATPTILQQPAYERVSPEIPRPSPTVASVDKSTVASDTYVNTTAPQLRSSSAIVVNQMTGRVLYAKNADTPVPIASISKLMMAMVVLDSGVSLDEPISVLF
ncbi:MAG: hypothetical protein ACREUA_08065, partial [Burkholderiales bacterium]